jgi:hypothetical protein
MALAQHRREQMAFEREEPRLEAFHVALTRGPIQGGLTSYAAQVRIVNTGRRDGSLQPIGRIRMANSGKTLGTYSALCIKPTDPHPFLNDEKTLQAAISAALDRPYTPNLPSGMPVEILLIFAANPPNNAQWFEVELQPFVGTGTIFRLKSAGEFLAEIAEKTRRSAY